MALSNFDRVGKALELLRNGLLPFVQRELKAAFGKDWEFEVKDALNDRRLGQRDGNNLNDVAATLVVMDRKWNDAFRKVLGRAERSLIFEILDARHRWAHQESFSSDDTDRMLDSTTRLLTAVSAPQADEVGKMKMELRRVIFDEQSRNERRKSASVAVETQGTSLKPWREVVNPHPDVASGRYQQAEFAADLWQVHLGSGTDEYRDPVEFFRRTYLTESLKQLLTSALQRLDSGGGDPVVQLQTNFGGGKTHSMLALYHLFSGTAPGNLVGLEPVLKDAKVNKLPGVRRAVLVGNKLSPGNPTTKEDGTVVNTLWGELAWQLGGRAAFEKIRADDERATSPGDRLRELMDEYGPCLILIDEWVAYARQLHDQGDLPGGNFETHFSFAQVLTESAKLAKRCLLVISLPASDTAGSPHAQADDVEVGGERGRAALDRLRNAVGRVESSWRPASAEEGFEIVRRRLFEPITEKAQFVARDTMARSFYELYRSQHQEFPPECRDSDYEKRLRAAYPIHPEIFDRLYNDWSTLVKFQRTRGVLRLMAAVIHSLWERGDRNPLILPANVPIDDPRVQFELTRYLSDNWVPILEKDVDGPSALPLRIDGEVPNLGKYAACRRVARTIYLGSAPTARAANRGLEDRWIKLGCVMPGESLAVFGDALRRLSAAATYLYQDASRFWYSTQPTVTKLAEDRAEQYKRDPDAVEEELARRLRKDLQQRGDFSRVYPIPRSGADVPDDLETRLVVLGHEYPYSKEPGNPAETAANALLNSRGNAPRLYQNTLVFLAPDRARLQELDDAIRRFLAWDSILKERNELNLDPHQVKQAETQHRAMDGAVVSRLPETYQWLLVPTQSNPQSPLTLQATRLGGQEALAVRASKKLHHDENLLSAMVGTSLKMELDKIPLWRGDHVAVKQLVEDFARYVYLPRLSGPGVLTGAIENGLSVLLWYSETFGYADSFDEAAGRYLGLKGGETLSLSAESPQGLLVKPEVAVAQLDRERKPDPTIDPPIDPPIQPPPPPPPDPTISPPAPQLTRFHGSVQLDATRVGRDASRIAEEVISHLAGLVGADVKVTLEIEAQLPEGASDQLVRTVTENCRVLKFGSQGFEED